MKTEIDALLQIEEELAAAEQLHPRFPTLHHAHSVIVEELEEWWELVKQNPKKLSESEREKRQENLRLELIQTAAMCVRAIRDLNL